MSKLIGNVRMIIPDLEDRILILKRASPIGYGLWNLPGGKIDLGQYITDVCRKEGLEETGLDIGEIRPLFFDESPISKSDGNHYLTFYNEVLSYSGKIVLNEESFDYNWIGPDQIDKYDFAFGNDGAIRRYYKEKR